MHARKRSCAFIPLWPHTQRIVQASRACIFACISYLLSCSWCTTDYWFDSATSVYFSAKATWQIYWCTKLAATANSQAIESCQKMKASSFSHRDSWRHPHHDESCPVRCLPSSSPRCARNLELISGENRSKLYHSVHFNHCVPHLLVRAEWVWGHWHCHYHMAQKKGKMVNLHFFGWALHIPFFTRLKWGLNRRFWFLFRFNNYMYGIRSWYRGWSPTYLAVWGFFEYLFRTQSCAQCACSISFYCWRLKRLHIYIIYLSP